MLVARRVARDGSFYAGPFMPAHFARKTMSLTHRLFGMRSCNEVITGKRDRPCLEYDIKRCIAPCVDALCSAEEYGRAVKLTQLFLEGRNDELIKTLKTRMADAAAAERFEEAAQHRDAMRTVQTLRDRQQKMATAEFGHRDVFGLKLGPAGVVIQVFQVRSGRVVERIELGTERGDRRVERRRSPARQRCSSSTSCGSRRRTSTCRLSRTSARRSRRGCPTAPAAACASSCRSAAKNGAWSTSRTGTPHSRTHAVQPGRQPPNTTRSRRCRPCSALPALPRRIECFDISTIQGSETVASMVVCEDGRMQRGEYRKFRIRGLGSGLGGSRREPIIPGSRPPAASHEPRATAPTTSQRCTKSCCAAIASCSSRAGRFPI